MGNETKSGGPAEDPAANANEPGRAKAQNQDTSNMAETQVALTAEEHLRHWIFFQRMKNLHHMELPELMDLMNELAPDASLETKTAIAFYMRHMRFICQAHCHFLEQIYLMTDDPEIFRLAEISLAADDFREHHLDPEIEARLQRYKRGWEFIHGCVPWRDCEHKRHYREMHHEE